MTGIYKATNLINNKSYIGQSVNISVRKQHHLTNSFNPNAKDYNCLFHRAIRKYGKDNFKWKILEECSIEELDKKEQYWINYYNTYIYNKNCNGYNMTIGGDAGYSDSPEIVEKIIFDLQNTNLSQKEIANKYSVHQTTVSDINIGDTWFNSKINYPIRENNILLNSGIKDKCPICNGKKSRKANICLSCYNKINKKERPTREELKNMIRHQSFLSIGNKYGVSDNTVRKWCDKYQLPRKATIIKQISDADWIKI